MRIALLGALWFFSAALAAPLRHHFATSLAEADYNAKEKSLEIALSLKPTDLEWVLSRRAGKRVDLERTEQVDELVVDYLREVFAIQDANGESVRCDWVGLEVETKIVWLYFEYSLPNGLEGVQLRNRLLLRWERDQVNTVNLTHGETRRTLTFDRGHTNQVLIAEAIPAGK